MHLHRRAEIYKTLTEFFELPTAFKKEGVTYMTWHSDRGGGSSVNRLLFQRLAQWEATLGDDFEARLRKFQAWIQDIPCVLHDLHGGLADAVEEVSVLTHTPLKSLTKTTYKTIRSVRESLDSIIELLDLWAIAHLDWSDEAFDYEAVLEFWLTLAVPEPLARMLSVRNLRFEDGRLRAASCFKDDENAIDDVLSCILGVMKITRFHAGRFVRSGEPASALLGASFLGLDSVVNQLLDDPDIGDWYLKCFRDYNDAARLQCYRTTFQF